MTSFYVTSFISQMHVCILCNKFYMTSFHMTSIIYWCERVYVKIMSLLFNRIEQCCAAHIVVHSCQQY
jgi:hypothetical protein